MPEATTVKDRAPVQSFTQLPPALSDNQSDESPPLPEAEPGFSPGVNKLLHGMQASQQGFPESAKGKSAADDVGELPSLQYKPRRNGSIRRATPQVQSACHHDDVRSCACWHSCYLSKYSVHDAVRSMTEQQCRTASFSHNLIGLGNVHTPDCSSLRC